MVKEGMLSEKHWAHTAQPWCVSKKGFILKKSEQAEVHSWGDALPRQLPEREQDGQFVVELLKLIKSAKHKLGLRLTFPQEPHYICLQRRWETYSGVSTVKVQFKDNNAADLT